MTVIGVSYIFALNAILGHNLIFFSILKWSKPYETQLNACKKTWVLIRMPISCRSSEAFDLNYFQFNCFIIIQERKRRHLLWRKKTRIWSCDEKNIPIHKIRHSFFSILCKKPLGHDFLRTWKSVNRTASGSAFLAFSVLGVFWK